MKDRVVVVTGGSAGIGPAIAGHGSAPGDRVLITGPEHQFNSGDERDERRAPVEVEGS